MTTDQRPTDRPTTDKETRRQGDKEGCQSPISNLQSPDNGETQHSTLNTQNFSSIPHPPSSTDRRSSLALRLPDGLTRGFRALRVRNYRLYWFGQLVSLIGTWMQTTAQAWLVLQLTQSPLALGLVTTLQFLPVMILSLFGGAIADRVSKHRLILWTQTASLIQAVIFGALVAAGVIQLWQLYLLAMIQGTINAIDMPVRQSFTVELVGREDLANAVGLNSMQFNTARIIGPAIAGLLIAQIGFAPAIFLNALSFVAVIAALLMMDASEFRAVPPRSEGHLWPQLREGLHYSLHTPDVLLVLILVAAIGTFGFNFSVILPLIAGFVLHTDAAGFGVLSSFLGIGSLAAAITTAYARQITIRRLLLTATSFSIILAAVALSPVFALSAVLLIALGFTGIAFATTANTLIQLTVPDALRGRVMGIYMLLFAGTTPIGGLLIGGVSDALGVPTALLLCALLCLLGVGGAVLYRRSSAEMSQKPAQ
jgi:MFS family permease